ncbi:MAG: hypothetical protein ABIR54_21850 [Burkholderiaceae bacterium]
MWLIVLVIALLVVVAPVMIAARIVGAGRTGFGYSLLALIVSFLIVGFTVKVFHIGGLIGFFVAPLGFMFILDTTYLRGLGIVILQYLIAAVLVFIVAFTALGSMLHMKDMMHDLPIKSTPSQSV